MLAKSLGPMCTGDTQTHSSEYTHMDIGIMQIMLVHTVFASPDERQL